MLKVSYKARKIIDWVFDDVLHDQNNCQERAAKHFGVTHQAISDTLARYGYGKKFKDLKDAMVKEYKECRICGIEAGDGYVYNGRCRDCNELRLIKCCKCNCTLCSDNSINCMCRDCFNKLHREYTRERKLKDPEFLKQLRFWNREGQKRFWAKAGKMSTARPLKIKHEQAYKKIEFHI